MISNASPSVGNGGGFSQAVSPIQSAMPSPISAAQSAMPSTGMSVVANSVPSSVTDAMGSGSSDVMAGADSAPKAPFTIGGAFSGFMVAIGLKDSPEEQAAKEQAQAAKDFAASQVPRTLDVVIETTVDANADADGHGLSTIFRFYPLQDSASFTQIGLAESGEGTALPYQEQVLLPNHMVQIREKYPSDSPFIGVLFQLHNRPHRWRLLIPVKRLQAGKPLHLVLGRCDIQVKDGLLPLPSVAATRTSSTSSKTINKPPVSAIEAALSSVCQ